MRFASILALVFVAAGCAARQQPAPVSTTQVTAAEVTVAEDAPRSGKAQKSTKLTDEEPLTKDGDRRTGDGFSGWK